MRDLNRSSSCIPKSEDRRRPPYFERSENAAPIRRSSNGRSEAKPKTTFYTFMSEANKHSIVHVSLRAKIGDGRHISSEARTRPLFADRATGRPNEVRQYSIPFILVKMSEANLIFCISCKPKSEDRRRPPYFERSENAAPIRRTTDERREAKANTTLWSPCNHK